MYVTLLLPLILSLASANSIEEKVLSLLAPAVIIENGTIIGSSTGIVDSFKGIPYAQPPVGDLRLRSPQSITKPYGTITAIGVPIACPQFYTRVNTSNIPQDAAGLLLDTPVVQAATVAGEDCLTLNVQRPSTATSSSKLPVVFWILGGGFEIGPTQVYDATKFITQSIRLGKPVIYVAVNYRVAGFGFLVGKEVQQDGSTNLGLRDRRLGLQWVQENIAAFGGDPSKVTIWGESAGAISVFDQTIINRGDNSPPSHLLAGSCGRGPQGDQYRVSWNVDIEGEHLFMAGREPPRLTGGAKDVASGIELAERPIRRMYSKLSKSRSRL